MSDDFEPVVRQLPNARTTPDTVLGRSLSKRDHIKGVLVCILWKDGTVDCDWSAMSMSDLVYLAKHADLTADDVLLDRREDTKYTPPTEPAA